MSRNLLILVVFLATATAVVGQVQPVVTMSFDQDLNGVGAKGVVVGTPVDKPVLVPGKFGQALKSGPTIGYVDYPTEGLLNRIGGTVEMWVCPLDWLPEDGKFHVFFEVKGQGALYLYKYWVGSNLLMLTCPELEGPYASSQSPTASWKPGEWHHIAGTWSPNGVMAYVDGNPAGKLPVEGALPKAIGAMFRIGDQPWQFERTTASLVDEVRIYDRALTPQHIAAHFAGNYGFTMPLTAETSRLDYSIDSLAGQVQIRVDTAGADVADARLKANLTLVPKGQAVSASTETVALSGGQASLTIPLPSRKPRHYEVVARLLLDGKETFELRRDLTIPTTEWLGNKLGLEDKVLPPWTPLTVTRRQGNKAADVVVSCWGRRYLFGGTLLPSQISSAGAELLARPVSLRLTCGGKEAMWEEPVMRVDKASSTRAELTGTASAKVGEGFARTNFTAHLTAEYDGLLLMEVSCDKPDQLPLEGLSLEIPVKAENALYRLHYGSSWGDPSGFVPKGEGVVEKMAFVPYAWLGDNDRGLYWFCESDEMWPNARAENAIEILRSGSEVTLRLNLLAKGQKLPPNWKLVFGLQATPVKPIPKDWRKWRLTGHGPVRKANVEIVWPVANKKDSLSQFGYPEAADPEPFGEHISGLHEKGLKAVPYLCLTYITGAIPEWQLYRKQWDMGPVDPSIPEAGWNHTFHMVSPVGKGYPDFILWKTREFLDRYGIDGAYHDQTSPYSSSRVESGVGYMREGKAYQTHPILGYRALYRRNYAVVKSLPRETFTMAHMSGKITLPVLAYDDSYLDGEHFRGVVKDSYMDVTTLDNFRAEFMGRQWGIMPFFIPEFDAEHAKQVEPTRGMMALLMIHDVSPWPIWCHVEVVNEAFAALDEFGYVDSDFIPYFDPTPPATTSMKDVYLSAYKRADGRALLIVANLSKENRQGEVRINPKRLGLPATEVASWPGRQPLTLRNGIVQLEVPKLGYRMLVVR